MPDRRRAVVAGYWALLIAVAGVTGCAVNPATGERQLILMSEAAEINMGREADQQYAASLGLYGGDELQRYMQSLGERMAATSERPDLPWTFRVVDDPIVNAFALPGGFIYITRGIMANFNSEAQLASVVGHEIGHVTARHSAEQLSRAQLAQVGLVAGTLLAPENLRGLADVAGAGLSLMFLKFGRDDERQADDLGLRYMRRLDYDPRPMVGVFDMLARVSASQSGGRVPEWMSTHPDPANRADRIREAIADANEDLTGSLLVRDGYLKRLQGMVYGEDPRQGYFEGSNFRHPELRFAIDFPTGWQTQNQKQAVVGVSSSKDAMVQLSLAAGKTLDQAAREFLGQQGLTAGSPNPTTINGNSALAGDFSAASGDTQLRGRAVWIAYGGTTYQVLGYGTSTAWSSHQNAVNATLNSFRALTDPAALNVQPLRIELVTLDRSMTLTTFAQRYPSEVPVETLALLNQVEPTEVMRQGTLVKRVVRGR